MTNHSTPRNRGISKVIKTLLFIFTIAFILYNSLQNGVDSSEASGSFTQWIQSILVFLGSNIIVQEGFIRTLAHFMEYALLGILAGLNILEYRNPRISKHFILIVSLVPFFDEIMQSITPGRAFQMIDLMVDYLGIVLGLYVVYLGQKIRLNQRVKR